MKDKAVWIALALLACALSGVAGAYVGANAIAKSELFSELGTSITLLDSNLKVIELLKQNEKEKAEELLETFIDVTVASLGVEAQQKFFSQNRDKIIEAIHRARTHRNKWPNPNHRVNENLRNGVEAAFKL